MSSDDPAAESGLLLHRGVLIKIPSKSEPKSERFFVLQEKRAGMVDLTFYDSIEAYETKADHPLGVIALPAGSSVQALQGQELLDQAGESLPDLTGNEDNLNLILIKTPSEQLWVQALTGEEEAVWRTKLSEAIQLVHHQLLEEHATVHTVIIAPVEDEDDEKDEGEDEDEEGGAEEEGEEEDSDEEEVVVRMDGGCLAAGRSDDVVMMVEEAVAAESSAVPAPALSPRTIMLVAKQTSSSFLDTDDESEGDGDDRDEALEDPNEEEAEGEGDQAGVAASDEPPSTSAPEAITESELAPEEVVPPVEEPAPPAPQKQGEEEVAVVVPEPVPDKEVEVAVSHAPADEGSEELVPKEEELSPGVQAGKPKMEGEQEDEASSAPAPVPTEEVESSPMPPPPPEPVNPLPTQKEDEGEGEEMMVAAPTPAIQAEAPQTSEPESEPHVHWQTLEKSGEVTEASIEQPPVGQASESAPAPVPVLTVDKTTTSDNAAATPAKDVMKDTPPPVPQPTSAPTTQPPATDTKTKGCCTVS